jgi:F-type H+-transporting ATPase subunit b
MEIFNNFGFEPTFFVAQIVNFLILAFLLKKYLYKPVLKVLKDREQKIAKGLRDAEDASLALEKAGEEKDQIIKAATLEAQKIIEETKKSAQELKEELMERSKKDADRIIKEAKDQAQIEIRSVEIQAKNMALSLSKKILDKILTEIFTKQEKDTIITRNIKKLEKYE